jgi:hypothetical protein
MWSLISQMSQWPLWNFLSVVLVIWITQRVIAWRERRTKLSDVQRELYLSTIPHLAEFYKLALEQPVEGADFLELQRRYFEIMSRFSIMGSRGYAAFQRLHHICFRSPSQPEACR